MQPWLDAVLLLLALAAALSMRPWRGLAPAGPPWPWVAWSLAMPLLWGADRYIAMPIAQPLSGACLLMMMAGWPLAMLALLLVAAITVALADLSWLDGLHRLVWLGIVPATVAMALGAALRRWLPHHLFIYLLGRGFFAALAAGTLAGMASAWLHGAPHGLAVDDLLLGRWLAAWADAWLCGLLVTIFVAYRPQWLATYADRIYLPRGPAVR